MKKQNTKISVLQMLRLLLQIVFFIFLPSICMQALNGIKQIYLAVVEQNFSAALLPQLIEVIALIPITILFGRFFCGWMCGFGSFTDFIYLISSKVFKRKIKVNEEADKLLKYIKYIVLAVLVSAVWTLDITVFKSANPWDAFGMLASIGKVPDFSYVISNLLVGFVILIGIIVASAFIERFFCRYLCPMGAVFNIASKLRISKIKKPKDKCGNCRICTNSCAMGIPLYQTDVVRSAECINCMKCITACPRGNTTYTIAKSDVRPLLASAASVAIMTGSYYSQAFVINATGNSIATSQTSETLSANKLYNDGTYKGTGTGFRGASTTISVTIKNDKITSISTVSSGDDKPYYDKAYSSISNDILSSQSYDVDAVSGATYSSNGIMEAVANALSQAKISDASLEVITAASTASQEIAEYTTAKETPAVSAKEKATSHNTANSEVTSAETDETTITTADTESSVTSAAATAETAENTTTTAETTISTTSGKYKDGTYQGSGTGFKRGTTNVTVVVSGGKISTITVDSYEDDKPFFSQAFSTVSQDIISSQSTDVDAVSGATYSSNGIMEAVSDALADAMQ